MPSIPNKKNKTNPELFSESGHCCIDSFWFDPGVSDCPPFLLADFED